MYFMYQCNNYFQLPVNNPLNIQLFTTLYSGKWLDLWSNCLFMVYNSLFMFLTYAFDLPWSKLLWKNNAVTKNEEKRTQQIDCIKEEALYVPCSERKNSRSWKNISLVRFFKWRFVLNQFIFWSETFGTNTCSVLELPNKFFLCHIQASICMVFSFKFMVN